MNKYKDALAYLRNSVLVTDHNQQERVNQCVGILQELVDKATPVNPVARHCENEGEAQNVIEEDIRELQEVKCMKKSDLVAGKHMVQYRDGNIRFVGEHGILLDSTGSDMNALNSYDESLLFNNGGGKLMDIVAVYEVNRIWKREDPTITEDEKTILRNLPINYEWIARDEDSRLYIYQDKPEKRENAWMGKLDHRSLGALSHLFLMIKWEDDEPWKIDDLLKLDVKESE